MGILTRLRNAFGRSRKGRAAEAEGAEQVPATEPAPAAEEQPAAAPKVPAPAAEPAEEPAREPEADPEPAAGPPSDPEPAPEPEPAPAARIPDPRTPAADEHELVAAAFDNVTVPKQPEPREAAPEPDPEPQPEREPQPQQAAEPEPAAEPEAEPEPEAEAAPAQPQAQEAEETEKPEEPEAQAAQEPQKPQAEEPHEPQEQAAQEPQAQEPHEPQEPQAEGTPQPATPDAESPTPDAEPPATETRPATPLPRLKSRAPGLTTAYKAATAALRKNDLTGARARVHLVLDRSASMRPYYKDGSAQALAEQCLALAAHLDPEATVHVTFFSTEVDGTADLTLTDHENTIDEVHGTLGRMGRTSYHAAVEAVLAHLDEQKAAQAAADQPAVPTLVVFQTDGAPDAKTPATRALADAGTSHPEVFFSFVAFGEHDNKAFDYLRRLKTGNASFFHAGPAPRELTDKALYEGVLASWRP
ncbi:VWA domain-containing protein [Streptomyces sp. NPDC018057]|uniref:VWA domain-containing protein n=1 Tax=unclassified Streptomyces TaxID=2593676 RepID=UPI0037908D63